MEEPETAEQLMERIRSKLVAPYPGTLTITFASGDTEDVIKAAAVASFGAFVAQVERLRGVMLPDIKIPKLPVFNIGKAVE